MITDKLSSILKEINLKGIKRTFQLLGPYILSSWKSYTGIIVILFADIFLTIGFAWFFGTITDAAVSGEFDKIKSLLLVVSILIVISQIVTF
ncbi:hypothetical protein KDJ21_013560 [Metabacillus litoralis]|nr:hypothetical protein [Metabacillus litoralis]UHA57914.1 hypothetical protein KDJ21_013560 [Metabacillus litoralis]